MEIFELLGSLNIKGADEVKSKLTSVETAANSLTIKLNKAGDAIASITAKSHETNKIMSKTSASISSAGNATGSTTSKFASLGSTLGNVGGKFKSVGNTISGMGSTLTSNVTMPILGLGAAIVGASSSFESSMARVSAMAGATGTQLQTLRDKAKEVGATTKFSASEAADGFYYMASAGWKTNDMLAAIEGTTSLAAASGEDLAKTTDIVTNAIQAFGLKASDASKIADLLANTAANSNTSVATLGQSFKYVAPVAGAMKYSIEDVNLALGLMGNAGIKASQAGTTLRAGLTRLAAPPKQAAMEMKALGISLTDSHGKMLPLAQVIDQLREKFSKLNPAQQSASANALFGKTAMAGWLALINSSPASLDKLTNATRNYSGAAQTASDIMLNNFGGQVTILKSTLEGIAIQIGELLTPAIRAVTGAVQWLASKFSALPQPVKVVAVALLGIVAAIGPIITIAGMLVAGIGAVIAGFGAIVSVGLEVIAIATVIGIAIVALSAPFAIAATAIGGAISYAVIRTGVLQDIFEKLKGAFQFVVNIIKGDGVGAFDALTGKLGLSNEAAQKWIERGNKVKETVLDIVDRIKQFGEVLTSAFSGNKTALIDNLAKTFGLSKAQAAELANTILDIRDKLIYFGGVVKNVVENELKGFIGAIIGAGKFLVEHKAQIMGAIDATLKWVDTILGVGKSILDFFGVTSKGFSETKSKISETAREFTTLATTANAKLDSIKVNGIIVTKKASEEIVGIYKKMTTLVVGELDKRQKEELSRMNKIFKDSKVLTTKEEKARLDVVNKSYDARKKLVEKSEQQIKSILDKASREKRDLTTKEKHKINEIQTQMTTTAVKILSKGETDQLAIYEDLKNKVSIKTQEEANAIIKNATKAKTDTIKQANDMYKDKVAAITKMRDQDKVITADEASAMIKEAGRTKDGVVKRANDTYTQTVAAMNKKKTKNVSTAEAEKNATTKKSTEMKNLVVSIISQLVRDVVNKLLSLPGKLGNAMLNFGSKVVKDIASGIAGSTWRLTTSISGIVKKIKDGVAEAGTAAKGFVSGLLPKFASGVQNFSGGWAVVGEQGAELVHLPAGTDVYSNMESRQMLKSSMQRNTPALTRLSESPHKESNGKTDPAPIIININNPQFRSRSDINPIMDDMVKRLKTVGVL